MHIYTDMRSVTLTDVATLEFVTSKFDICNTSALPYVAFVCCYTDSWMAYLQRTRQVALPKMALQHCA